MRFIFSADVTPQRFELRLRGPAEPPEAMSDLIERRVQAQLIIVVFGNTGPGYLLAKDRAGVTRGNLLAADWIRSH